MGLSDISLSEHARNLLNDDFYEIVKYFYTQLYGDFSPDITGYCLIYLIPPDLSGTLINGGKFDSHLNYSNDGIKTFNETSKFLTFAAIDFTPPQSQINTEQFNARTGGFPYATEVSESDQLSVTYLDTINLDVYNFHLEWLEYIRGCIDGRIIPNNKYIDDSDNNSYFGTIDYMSSLYVIKFRPDMKDISYIAKCTGIFPQNVPSKEIIGQRSSNEMTTLPFNYFCSGFREAVVRNNSALIRTSAVQYDLIKEVEKYLNG